ncbi:MAG TPA: hypothetical protein VMZ69_10440 [Saprospiraceae bacterium]|nr:hypothetical protein [Saprospiraceae bacterium]
MSTEQEVVQRPSLANEKSAFLNDHFLFISELGKRVDDVEGFMLWCEKQKLPFEKTVEEFIKTKKKYLSYVGSNGLISGIIKIKTTKGFDEIGLDDLYYQDFYAIERFGKTKLGTLLHFAKQGQNKSMMKEISELIKLPINRLLKQYSIDAVGFIPPTIKREVQIMHVLQKNLNLPIPAIDIRKVKGEIVIPQKALSKIEDRIANAKSSIVVPETKKYRRILLIDDAIGSGATMNETAIKLKKKEVTEEIIGYAVTGSFKEFDVIQEV